MKKLWITLTVTLLAFSSFTQEDPNKKMPPLDMLPKDGEVKHIYQLPNKVIYKIYNIKGALVDSGNAQFIDYTNYEVGTYFVRYSVTERIVRSDP